MTFRPLPPAWRRMALCALLGFMGLAFWAALQPRLAPSGLYGFDKLVHAGAFGLLTLLGILASAGRRAALLAVLAVFALGAAIEAAQSFVPGREASLSDLAGDAVGIAAGIATARLGHRAAERARRARHGIVTQPTAFASLPE
ncbi:VanZ family protein [Azospirillum isscasi]|uniref:VanZ family protein n=1 Tax=Azospirillum isscasi TaxID=3053926 RepID=A0ABU0WIC5_9PROT|nr:VanZ family protein [Azospirillum isscasi]MDQ2103966.1 VanZ family protein [Azospirillum isscasi]